MNKLYQDTMTDTMRHDLSMFCYKQGYLDEPPIGHWPSDLIFPSQPDQAADADQQAAPDPHYFAAQGQEPPPAKKRHWWNNAEVNVLLFFMAAYVVILALCPVW